MAQYDRLVFGMSWRTAISDDRKELQDYAKELSANSYVEVAFDVKHKYGFVNLKKIDKAQSAAVILGQILESGNGVFVHQINREEHCFIAVRETLPVEDCDIVGSREVVIAAAKKYAEDSRKKDGIAPKIYGDAEEIGGSIALPISKLIDDGEDLGVIKRVRSINGKVAVGIVGILLTAGAWFLPDLIAPDKPQIAIDPKSEHHKAVIAAINSVVDLKQFPFNVMPSYINFVNTFPTEVVADNRAGKWKLDSLTCIQTDCTATWKREGSITNADFLKALSIDSADLSISFPGVDAISRKISFKKNESAGKLLLGTQLKFGETVLSWLQTLKDKPRTDPMTPLVQVSGAFKPDPMDMPMVGNYAFTVPYSELSKVATLPNVITIEQITLTYKDPQNIKFEIQGKYYAL
ncbi:hypothetical protein GCM10027277_57960 [Pseudoduganella ginsengisoli]|uniref:Type 4b pilus protein PilO2 n=1 Tax=Pseudoduganella ginsengisoli TaxID=1462440 RepID=A0A6L6Q8Y6_9BURK|nr:type 4b pilus protein PilO2 [Pseudoduganella ginsengisoli]MTW05896.1 type 4b pilus protein PilO2 [Pseudoduganella ginsengisoli]